MNFDRQIAKLAQELVKGQASGQPSEAEYRSFAEGFPVLLRTAGLLQTAVFLKAKGGHPHGTIYQHLESQLKGLQAIQKDLVETVSALPTVEYRLQTQVTARIAYWHKRMAQAYLKTRSELKGPEGKGPEAKGMEK